MGEIIKIKGANFAGYPGVVNISELPAIRSGLIGFYTGKGSVVDSENRILEMPSVFIEGPVFRRITGQTKSPVYPFSGSTNFKGDVIRSLESSGTTVPGLNGQIEHNLTNGVSFSFLLWRPSSSTGSSRTLFSIEAINLQFRVAAAAGVGHLTLNGEIFDVGFHGLAAGVEAITVTLNRTEFKIYRNGALLSTTNISGSSLPETIQGNTCLLGTWTGNGFLQSHQIKQIYIHSKVLNLAEVQSIANNLSKLTV